MNAHADMLIVVKHNEKYIPRGIYRSPVSGVWKFARFLSTKTSANKRLLLCLLPSASNVRHPSAQVYGDKITLFILYVQKNIVFHHIVINAPYIAIHNYYPDIIESFPTVSRRSTDGQRFWDRPIPLAFDNKVALTDDLVIVWATYVSALPIANRQKSWFALGPKLRSWASSYCPLWCYSW